MWWLLIQHGRQWLQVSKLTCVIVKLNTITNICKYKWLHEGHHFIPMAMEVHGALGCDMDCFIKECAHFLRNRRSGRHLSLSFYIQLFRQCVNIILPRVLASTIERKIVLASDVCSKPPIIIRSHDLHVGDIRGVVGDIISYHERD
jgi:hypothetical protein